MKSIISALALTLALSACAGLSNSSRGSTANSTAGAATSQDYGVRNATRDFPYDPAY